MPPDFKAFTLSAKKGLLRVLRTEVYITQAFDNTRYNRPPTELKKFLAIWDTGATTTTINAKVVAECNLKPIGIGLLKTANQSINTTGYLIALRLPNGVGVPALPVYLAPLGNDPNDPDVLIGMDIINEGDFAVTNVGRRTIFSFRIPSMETIDFVPEKKSTQPITRRFTKVGRNAPCPCGSGKKFKKCCEGKVT